MIPFQEPLIFPMAFVMIAPGSPLCSSLGTYIGYKTANTTHPRWLFRFLILGFFLGAIAPLGMAFWNIQSVELDALVEIIKSFALAGASTGVSTSLVIMTIWKRFKRLQPNQAL